MRWLIEDLKQALRQLRRSEIWLFLGVLAGFTLLAIVVAQFAFQTDTVLRYLHLTIYACREMTNGPIIFLFCGMIFFLLASTVTFGEIQRYYQFKRRGVLREARKALTHGLSAGGIAITIAIAALVFFKSNCR